MKKLTAQKIPLRVKNCITHHYACECQHWRYEEFESALKIIHTWASVISRPKHQSNAVEILDMIAKKSVEALGCLEGVTEQAEKRNPEAVVERKADKAHIGTFWG